MGLLSEGFSIYNWYSIFFEWNSVFATYTDPTHLWIAYNRLYNNLKQKSKRSTFHVYKLLSTDNLVVVVAKK